MVVFCFCCFVVFFKFNANTTLISFHSSLKKERASLLQVKNNMAADLERLLSHREVTANSAHWKMRLGDGALRHPGRWCWVIWYGPPIQVKLWICLGFSSGYAGQYNSSKKRKENFGLKFCHQVHVGQNGHKKKTE